MNAHTPPPTRAQQQALAAPFVIDDVTLVGTIARIADERGTSMIEIVDLAIQDYLQRLELSEKAPASMLKFWEEHPMPLPTGLKADKAFFDALSGDL
ncbi:hypothetical protein [Sphingomonas bacterium]|uniref:hypothetical protein n=1 Tax=Sphingomonas bacterium TaxID=1895847 RepID=UPI001576B517|nr:hypothetical protein [Sphingomonas bacterium]